MGFGDDYQKMKYTGFEVFLWHGKMCAFVLLFVLYPATFKYSATFAYIKIKLAMYYCSIAEMVHELYTVTYQYFSK